MLRDFFGASNLNNLATKLDEAQALGFSSVAGARDHLVWLINNGTQEFLRTAVQLSGFPYLRVGQRFTLTTDEKDTDHNDEERITPAGAVWRVLELEPNCDPIMQYGIVCDQTGGWIHITQEELGGCGCQLIEGPILCNGHQAIHRRICIGNEEYDVSDSGTVYVSIMNPQGRPDARYPGVLYSNPNALAAVNALFATTNKDAAISFLQQQPPYFNGKGENINLLAVQLLAVVDPQYGA